MWSTSNAVRRRRLIAALGLLLATVVIAGCVSDGADSELPWATPEPWEGSVTLPPGMMRE